MADRPAFGPLGIAVFVAAALAGGCSHSPQPEAQIPAAALRPAPQDTIPHMRFVRFLPASIDEPDHGSLMWVGLRRGSAPGAEPNCSVHMRWLPGVSLAPVSWGPWGGPGGSPCAQVDGTRPGTRSGRVIGDHALHFRPLGNPRFGNAMLQVARGPATAHINATVHGGSDAGAVRVVEQLALRFCERVDRALEYIGAQNHRQKLNGATVWCRRMPNGALVGELAALCDALDGEVVALKDGATVVVHAGGHDVWLDVGLTTAQIGKDTTKLSFPTLQWTNGTYIADLSGLAALLGVRTDR